MVRLLRLVVDHGVERVQRAFEHTQGMTMRSVKVVTHYIRSSVPSPIAPVSTFTVIPPDLGRYDDLLTGGAAL